MVSDLVTDPTHWKYSSARNFQDDHTVLEIDSTGFWVEFLRTVVPLSKSLAGAAAEKTL